LSPDTFPGGKVHFVHPADLCRGGVRIRIRVSRVRVRVRVRVSAVRVRGVIERYAM